MIDLYRERERGRDIVERERERGRDIDSNAYVKRMGKCLLHLISLNVEREREKLKCEPRVLTRETLG